MFGQDFNPNVYGLMETLRRPHPLGRRSLDTTRARPAHGKHGEAGGGHAHVGAMIYLGDNWPDRYRNSVFTCNIHGHRVNHDRLEREGLRLRRPATTSDFLLGQRHLVPRPGAEVRPRRRRLPHRLVRHRRVPRDRRRQRPPRERPDLQDHLRQRQQPFRVDSGKPRRRATGAGSSSTRTSGTSAPRGACSRSGPRPERLAGRCRRDPFRRGDQRPSVPQRTAGDSGASARVRIGRRQVGDASRSNPIRTFAVGPSGWPRRPTGVRIRRHEAR